jgi:hypothetical protein
MEHKRSSYERSPTPVSFQSLIRGLRMMPKLKPNGKELFQKAILDVPLDQSQYPIAPNGTYGITFLRNVTSIQDPNAQWVPIPNISGQPNYDYYLAALNVTLLNDTWCEVIMVPFVVDTTNIKTGFGYLPAVRMLGRYVITGVVNPTNILIAFPGPSSCTEGPVPGWPTGGYFCCKYSCPAMMDFYENYFQLAVGYAPDNSTNFIAIGNTQDTFGETPYDIPLTCLTPPCARLTVGYGSSAGNTILGVRRLARSVWQWLLNKLHLR